jgi:glyceraldehyde 3-phosphate dehydrogenase
VTIKIGINGFGRIGDPRTFVHLLKYDTAMGIFEPSVGARDGAIVVDGRPIRYLSVPDAGAQPWGDLGAKVVIESTGHLTDATKARAHIDRGGARKVVISAPAKNQDATCTHGLQSAVQYVAVVTLTVELQRLTNADPINAALEEAAAGPLRGILA